MMAVTVGRHTIGAGRPLAFIAGPCVIENADHVARMAERLADIAERLSVPLIFKASFDKANRSSLDSFRGPGLARGLEILMRAGNISGLALCSDIHQPEQAAPAAKVLDLIQIPAFLCRQTDLLVAAAKTGKAVNVKKGQFLAPWDMRPVVEKLMKSGAGGVLLTERGASFGYNRLVSDMRSLVEMRELGHPVVFDATHSVQLPGGLGTRSDGEREYIPALARAAVAAGCDAVFLEVHDAPETALSDGPNMLDLEEAEALMRQLRDLHAHLWG